MEPGHPRTAVVDGKIVVLREGPGRLWTTPSGSDSFHLPLYPPTPPLPQPPALPTRVPSARRRSNQKGAGHGRRPEEAVVKGLSACPRDYVYRPRDAYAREVDLPSGRREVQGSTTISKSSITFNLSRGFLEKPLSSDSRTEEDRTGVAEPRSFLGL